MGLDIRLPMGIMFGILGAILVVFGLLSDQRIYTQSLGININLWWGAVILLFGVLMIVLALRARVPHADHPSVEAAPRANDQSPTAK